MSFIYINEQGAKIGVEGGYFVITYKNDMVKKVPKETLESVTVFGNVYVSTQCNKECLDRGIPVNFFSANGSYFGRLSSIGHTNPFRLKQQVYASDKESFALAISKRMIEAKISNQIVLLRRYQRNATISVDEYIRSMEIAKRKIMGCIAIEMLMGYEGYAAKEYFAALSKLVQTEFAFKGRSKQPPLDPFNSMLSLGYTILLYEIYSEIENRGLNPYIGFLHTPHINHPALASDMMEEWRAIIVDSVVMSLVQGNEIKIEHFHRDEESGGVFLTHEGMRIFIRKMEKKLRSNFNYQCGDEKASYVRRGIYLQSVSMTKAIEQENSEIYEPVYIR